MKTAEVDPATATARVDGAAPLRVLVGSAVLVAIVVGAPLLLPRLIDMPVVRAELERRVSAATSAAVRWESLDVGLLPAPYGHMHGVSIDLPGRLRARADEVRIDLGLRALLSRRVEVTAIRLARPVLHATVPAFAPDPDGPSDPMMTYRRIAGPLAAALGRIGSDTTVIVDDADLTVDMPALPWTLAMTLSGRGTLGADGATIEASATGAAIGNVRASARLAYAGLGARVTLHANNMNPQGLLDRVLPAGGPALEVARADVNIDVTAEGTDAGMLGAKVAVHAPTLRIARRGAVLEASPASVEADMSWRAGHLALSLDSLRAGDLVPAGRAALERRSGDAAATLTAEIPALDLARVRDAALVFMDDGAPLRAQVARVRAGAATGLRVTVDGVGGVDPARVEAQVSIRDGRFELPGSGLAVSAIGGRLEWSGGSLRGEGIVARTGGSRIDAGAFAYRFADGRASVSAPFDADIAEALAAVRRSLPRERAGALDAIESTRGRARGRFAGALAGRRWSADATIARSDALIRLRGLPWPVALREGRVSATPGRVDVAGVAGGVGESLFRDAGATLRLAGPLHLEDGRGSARVALAEVLDWLRTQPALAPMVADVGAVQGSVEASLTGLSGDPRRIAQARYELALVPSGVGLALRGLPDTLSVEGGVLRLAPQALRFQDLAVSMLDARGRVSGTVTGVAGRDPAVYANVEQGTLGAGMLAWAWARAGLPDRLEPRAPLSFDVKSARWSRGAGLDLQGGALIEAGPALRADLAWRPGDLDVRRLRVEDSATDATVALRIRGQRIDAGFVGALDGRSIGRAFPLAGTGRTDRVEGSLRGTLDRDRPREATAAGRLAVRDVDLAWLVALPLRIERGTIESDGARIRVPAATVWLGDHSAELSGEVAPGAAGPVVDADVNIRGIAVEALLAALRGPGEAPASEATPAAPGRLDRRRSVPTWRLPVSGTLRLRAGVVEYGGYRVEPVVAALTVDPTRILITATQASLCGIALPFSVELSADRVVASLRPRAVGQEITGTVRCLTEGSVQLTGTYDLDADLHAQGRPEELLASLRGRVDAEARAGTVERFALLGNILSVRGIGTTLSGLASGQRATGFDYRRMAVGGDIEGGVLRLDEAVFDSAAVGMVATGDIDMRDRSTRMTVLVAPFGSIDRLARRIPVIGYVLGGTLTSIPVQVSGDIRNPRVVPLGPEALSAELRGVFQRALRLPHRALRALEVPAPATPPAVRDGLAPAP